MANKQTSFGALADYRSGAKNDSFSNFRSRSRQSGLPNKPAIKPRIVVDAKWQVLQR